MLVQNSPQVDEGDYDELDFEEDFADDEERMGGPGEGDNGADDEEARELEERLKREMRAANRVGDSGAQEESADESDLEEEERKTLTGTGKQMKKLMRALGRREGNEAYESDEDKNPYASDVSTPIEGFIGTLCRRVA